LALEKCRRYPRWRPGVKASNALFKSGNSSSFAANSSGRSNSAVAFRSSRAPDLTRGLHVLRLLDQNALIVLEQSAFEEQQRTILLERVDQHDVAAALGVARAAPFQFLGRATAESDGSEFPERVLPLLVLGEVPIDLGVHPASRALNRRGIIRHDL